MRPWRRRKQAPEPVVLPSLDRLAGLIERVVELVDEVSGGSTEAPPPQPERRSGPAPARPPEPVAPPAAAPDGHGWLAFVASPDGYALVPRNGAVPEAGDRFELDGRPFRVLRHAPSPLPGDGRRCVVVEREEPPEADRSSGE